MDFRELYTGRLHPSDLAMYVRRLLQEPWSRFRAARAGGDEWLGWTPEMSAAADLYDLTQVHTQVSGNARRPRVRSPYPRPEVRQRPQSIRSFPAAALAAAINR